MSYRGSPYYDMALDGGYRGEEAEQVAAALEAEDQRQWEEHWEQQRLEREGGLMNAVTFRPLNEEEIQAVKATAERGRCNPVDRVDFDTLRVGYQRQLNFTICHLAYEEAEDGTFGAFGYLCAGVAKRNKHDDVHPLRGLRFALQRAFENWLGVPEGAEPGKPGDWRRSLNSLALDDEYPAVGAGTAGGDGEAAP